MKLYKTSKITENKADDTEDVDKNEQNWTGKCAKELKN